VSSRLGYLTVFLSAAGAVALITPLIRWIAVRVGAIDQPSDRKIHPKPTPTIGGMAILVGALVGLGVAYLIPPFRAVFRESSQLQGALFAALAITFVGLVDDVRTLSAPAKIAGQVLAAGILILNSVQLLFFWFPTQGVVSLGSDVAVPLTVLWVLVMVNAINLIDGLDGLASGAVLIASMSLWWVARTHGDFYVMFVSSLMAGATLGFLRYNFPPARVFMGDTGSNFLGLVLAAASLLENRKGTAAVTLLFPLVAMGLPIADGVLAFARRALRGTPVFRPDSEHIHHRLLRLGLSPRNALFVLWYLCLYLGVMAVVLAALPREYAWMMLGLLAAGLVFAFEVLEFIDKKLSEGREPPDDARR
jgi:UDP-GlcNAc:undecaprenyl-phosphate/decaprenyl-phosphate GlcNAc-1-phosphate transferase